MSLNRSNADKMGGLSGEGDPHKDQDLRNHEEAAAPAEDLAGASLTNPAKSGGPVRRARARILVLDAHPVTRYGLVQLLNQEPDLIVCGEGGTATSALASLGALKPDLLVTDILLPDKSCLDLVKEVSTLHPGVQVLVVGNQDETIYAERLLRAGARGYIMKNEETPELLKAIRQVLTGQIWVSKNVSTLIVGAYAAGHRATNHSELALLSDREFQVFELLAQGLTSDQIARQLRISPKTVDTHRWHIKEKFRLRTLPDLMKYALRWGASQGSA